MIQRLVLVVDDHEDNRQILAAVLDHEGYEVLTAEGTDRALELARQRPPDLILLDLMMPERDGWVAIAELRKEDRTRGIPVVAVTAKDEAGLTDRLRDAGFCGYLKKPFFPKEALDAVSRCLNGGPKDGWIDLPDYESLRPRPL
jgi:CheY-like chemotaxis protein